MLAAELAEGRRAAEALMADTCVITRAGEGPVFDPSTGTYTDAAGGPVYDGPCRVQVTDSLNARTPEAGGDLVTVQQLVLQVPVAATGVKVGDVATLITAKHDPDLINRKYRVVATHAKTHATARRLQCEEITGG